jgi:NarL family two-component system response regulator LiaR
MSKIKVLIADDHEVMRMGLATMLETDPSFRVVGEASDGAEAVAKALELRPDVVVMDLVMPQMDGSEATARIKESTPGTKVLLLTTFGTADGIAHALNAGAEGALLKSAASIDILKAVKRIASGEQVVSKEVREFMLKEPPVPELTERQREILESMTEGLINFAIAKRLGISEDGVKRHANVIFRKLGVGSRSEAIALAFRKHLLKA